MASAPEWINRPRKPEHRRGDSLKSPSTYRELERWREGERNDRLFGRAASMRSIGLSPKEIAAALLVANAEHCDPPLDPPEVAEIANSAGQRPEGRRVDRRLRALELGPYAIAIYVALSGYTDWANRCFPSITTLAKASSISRDTVLEAIKTLESAGLIRVERTGRNNVYTLLEPPMSQTNRSNANKRRTPGLEPGAPHN